MRNRGTAALIGRDEVMATLGGALDRAASGAPSVVVVAGETGIGKTRLMAELLARHDGPQLAGACVPVAGEPLAYAALTQALRRASGSGVVRQELARSGELARLMPGAAGTPGDAARAEAGHPESSRLRLFQSVLALLERMGVQAPVVLVVEDVHWADRSTLDLLAFLTTNLADERVLVLLTCREESVAGSRDLAEWLAELGRLGAERIDLTRLTRPDAAQLVAELADRALSPERLEETLERSAGNPLFVEHLVLTEGEEPGPLPSSLRDLLRSRVERLAPETRRVLRAMSVIGGRGAPVPVLAAMLAVPEEEVEDQLRVAIDASVADVRSDHSIAFQHPAFREVVYAELLPGERTRLHRSAAEALEAALAAPGGAAGVGTELIGEVARHWHRAGDPGRALRAAVAAGAAYERVYAYADAQASFSRAVELLDRVDPEVLDPDARELDRVDLAVRGAEAAALVGERADAVRLLEGALPHAQDDRVRAGLLERLGSVHFMAGDSTAAELALRSAMALIGAGEVSPLAARVHARFGLLAAAWSWLAEAEPAYARALEISRAVGARREEGIALNAAGVVAAVRGDAVSGVDLLHRALAIAREVESPSDVGLAYVNLSHVLGVAGRLEEGVALCHEGIAELSRYGQDRQVGSLLLCNASDALIKAGRVAEADELIDRALARHPRGIMAAPVLLFAARVAVARGSLDVAWERGEQARLVMEAEGAPLAWTREVVETAVEVELWAGRSDAAYELAADGLAELRGTDEALFGTALVALGLRALADGAVAHRDHRSRTRRAGHRDRMLAVLGEIRAAPGRADLPEVEALDLLCAAELARLDAEPAAQRWAAVVAAWTEIGRPLPAAYARWRHAEALLAEGAGAPAIAALRAAHESSVRLGLPRLEAETRTLAKWYRIDLVEEPAEPASAVDEALDAYALTAREREVLAAVAAGQTNQEIADALFISVKTASVHVSNILRKLDVPGRQEAARVAHRLGLSGSVRD